MEGGGGVSPKVLHLQRALSGGFGFSLMGGRGTGFPPVICDILSDSPASECQGMQVGDIILEINNETMENKSTKEVVTALMKSPDELILKVREDKPTRDRVLKFLAPLDKSPSSQHRGFKSTTIISPKPKIEKRDFTTINSKRIVCTSDELNGLEAGLGESDSSPDLSARLGSGTSNGETDALRGLQSPVLPNRTGFDSALKEIGKGVIQEHLIVTPKSTDLEASQPTLVNSHSATSDTNESEEFVGEILTTTALIHREDSVKESGLSAARHLDVVEEGSSDVLDGCVQSSTVLAKQELIPETDLTESSAETDVKMNNGHSKVELVRITSNQLPMTYSHSQDVRTRIENGTNISYNNDTMLSSNDSAFITSSPLLKVKTTATTISLNKNTPSEVRVKSIEQPVESSRPKLSTNAIGIQTNPSDLEPRIENGGLKRECEVPIAMAAPTTGPTKLGNGGSVGSVVLPTLTSTDRDRESSSSSGSDDYEFPDMNSLESALHENPKNLDVPSAKRLAKRLYELDGFKREDVSIHLSKRNDFCKLVAREYLSYFDFTGDRLDEALRDFLRCVTVVGETQERERVLAHFSHRYFECNPGVVESSDAAHTLTCAVMLLNTDLHGQNIGKKMTLNAFVMNLEGMNDGISFPRPALKALYNAIKSQPLEWIVEEEDDKSDVSSTGKGSKKLPRNGTLSGNPLVQIDDDPNAPVYIQTYIMRKLVTDAEGKKTPKGKRGWKMYFGTVKGLCIYLHKSEVAKDLAFNDPKDVMRIHHALASRTGQYDKKPNVFSLRLANWSEYLVQCLDVRDMQSWMQAVNLAASVHSSPPLPAAVGSQMGFRRPILPSATSKQEPAQQLAGHDEKIEALERELEDHRSYPPDKKAKAKVIKDYTIKDEYLEYEISRFKTYIYLLRSQPFSSLPPRSATPAPVSSSSVAKRSSPAPVPKFASSHSSSTLSRSASAPNQLPKYTSSSSSLSKSSSSMKSPSDLQRLSPEANSKTSLRRSNSNSGSHSDPEEEEDRPLLRDKSNKVHRSFSDRYSYRMAIHNSIKMN